MSLVTIHAHIDWQCDTDLPCYKCGQPCAIRPERLYRGYRMIMTLCPSCRTPNNFVDGQAAQIVLKYSPREAV